MDKERQGKEIIQVSKDEQAHLKAVIPFLKETEMFSILEESELARVAEHSQFDRIEKKQTVFREGDSPKGGFIVGQGRLILKKGGGGKKAVIAELLGRGDPFGVVCAARGEPYPMSAEALCESVVLTVEQEFLVSLTNNTPKFATHLFDLCRARFQAAQEKFARLAHADSKVRVASALLLFSEKFTARGGSIIEVTRDELSQIAGVTVETCIRVTKQFEKDGILAFPESKKIELVNNSSLEELAS